MLKASVYKPFREWAGLDSNQRRRKPADLQSAPFGHSGTYPLTDWLSPAEDRGGVEHPGFFVSAVWYDMGLEIAKAFFARKIIGPRARD